MEKGVCHKKCQYGNAAYLKTCVMMDKHGHCYNCSCHWTDHFIAQDYYVPCQIEEVVEVSALKAQYQEGQKELSNSSILLCKGLDDLIKAIDGLENCQIVIKKSGDFIMEHAARKKPYLDSYHFKEQIEEIRDDKDKNW